KGKEKVVEEQAAHDLLTLQTPKNKSPVDQFIFQRRTPMPAEASGPAESPSLDAELALTNSETESDDEVPKINTGDQDEGQAGPNPGIQDEGQARPNPGVQDEGQGEELGKTNAEAEVQLMVSAPIHQDTSSVPPMTTPVIDLMTSQSGSPIPTSSATTSTVMTTTTIPPLPSQPQQSTTDRTLMKCIDELEQHMANLLQYNLALEERLDKHSDLPAVDMKEILQQRMFKDKSYEAHEDCKKLYDVLEKSLEHDYSDQLLSNLEEARQKKRKRRDVTRTPFGSPSPQPPHPPPPAGASGALDILGPSGSSQFPPPPPPSSTGTSRSTQQQGSKALNDSIPDKQVHLSDDEDSENDHLPTADLRKGGWKPLPAEERPATPKPTWTIPSSNVSDVENNWATALASTYVTPAENALLAKTEI
nr:hypothetical protein [Tanacetum cinerariifolium]